MAAGGLEVNRPLLSQTALWPPRRMILVAGIVAVTICLLVGTDLTTVALIGGTALAVFSMGHVERKMHPIPASRSSRETMTHSTDETAENRARSTTATTTEINHD